MMGAFFRNVWGISFAEVCESSVRLLGSELLEILEHDLLVKLFKGPLNETFAVGNLLSKSMLYIMVARFFLVQTYQNRENIPNDHQLYQTCHKLHIPNGRKIGMPNGYKI
jgi:hypothetical protein